MSEGDAREPEGPSEGERPRPPRRTFTTGSHPRSPMLTAPAEADPLATSGIRPDAGTKATAAERRMLARVGHYAHRGITLPVATWSLPFLAILGIAALIFVSSFWLDLITAALDEHPHEVTATGLLHSILYQDLDQACA